MNLEIIPLAQRDVDKIARYYREQRLGLDDEFFAELNASVARIAQNPLAFEQIRPGIRRCLLNRFPYGVYFRMPDAETVRIIVVSHHHRRPGYGLRRR